MKRALKALSRSEVARRLAQVSMDAQHEDLWLDEVWHISTLWRLAWGRRV